MNLSLREAAEIMGKSIRQVRYLIQKGLLPAHKEGGHWSIPKASILLAGGQQRAIERKRERAAEVAEEVLRPSKPSKAYSVIDLRAFETGRAFYREARNELGAEHPVVELIRTALVFLGCGCHAFQPRQPPGDVALPPPIAR